MHYKKRYILALCIAVFSLACTSLRGQTYPYVYSLSIYPSNPTENDTVKLIAADVFATSGYQPVTKSVLLSGNNIQVDATYCTPTLFLNVISYITDTIVIGLLAPGTYNLNYTLSTSLDSACTTFMQNDTASISFMVTPDSGIAPVANFICSDDTANACCFNFTDLSTENPNSWLWSFPGASPSSSALQNPTTICYTASGAYDVTLQVSNGSGGDSITRSGVISVGFAGCICSDAVSIGLKELSAVHHDLLSLYPNPMVDLAILDTKAALLNSKLDLSFVLYDVLGREVRNLEIEHPQTPINRGDLERGLYFYQINNGNAVLKTGKILME